MLKKTTLWLLSLMMLVMMVAGCGGGEEKKAANDSQKLIVYTSMKESLIKGIVEGFKKANPGIDVDYQSAGAGKLMAKIAAERQSGKILADVIWTSEVPDFYKMKEEGILLNYKSPVTRNRKSVRRLRRLLPCSTPWYSWHCYQHRQNQNSSHSVV